MAQLGKLLVGVAARCLIVTLKQIPGVGACVEYGDEAVAVARRLREEQDKLKLDRRIKQLEEAAALTPEDARAIAENAVRQALAEGQKISPAHAEAVWDLMAAMPARIAERTRATIEHARKLGTAPQLVLPVSRDVADETVRDEFYARLLPVRRPQFAVGDAVPFADPNWRFDGLIGSGGFGEVWKVVHRDLGDEFALKFCLDARSAAILKREAQSLLTLRQQLPEHPNIVRLVNLNLRDEPFWLAFEFIAGGTLDAWILAANGPHHWEDVAPLAAGILNGMAAAHDIGIVHRDVNPANILLTPTLVPKIADFGLGKIIAEQEADASRSRSLHTMAGAGTLGYMSPEQQQGKPADPADDVYALGVVLFQMLVGSTRPPQYVRSTLRGLTPVARAGHRSDSRLPRFTASPTSANGRRSAAPIGKASAEPRRHERIR